MPSIAETPAADTPTPPTDLAGPQLDAYDEVNESIRSIAENDNHRYDDEEELEAPQEADVTATHHPSKNSKGSYC